MAFSDFQRLQFLRESIQDAVLILSTNVDILHGIQELLESLKDHGIVTSASSKKLSMCMEEELRVCISRLNMHRRWAETSLDRIHSTSVLVSNPPHSSVTNVPLISFWKINALLGYRHDASISQNTKNTVMMAQAAEKDSKTMLSLTNATKQDSKTMKLVTVITMIYLPGTFMAVRFTTWPAQHIRFHKLR